MRIFYKCCNCNNKWR
ncbi:hypothetical protein [Flavobacterium sp. CECT 9288]